jgi:hypothetical protein
VSATDKGSLFANHLRIWRQRVSESLLVQINLFRDVQQGAARPEQQKQTLALAQAGLQRTQEDYRRLNAEKQELLERAKENKDNPPDLSAEERRLQELRDGEGELRHFIQQLKDAQAMEPKRQKFLSQVTQAQLLERDADIDKAIALYEQALNYAQSAGFQYPKTREHVEQLKQQWQVKGKEHEEARDFIYHVWPTLDTAGLKDNLDHADKAFEVVSKARDKFSARKLLLATEAHAVRLNKELQALNPVINLDDQKPAKLIKELAPRLAALARKVSAFLDRA